MDEQDGQDEGCGAVLERGDDRASFQLTVQGL